MRSNSVIKFCCHTWTQGTDSRIFQYHDSKRKIYVVKKNQLSPNNNNNIQFVIDFNLSKTCNKAIDKHGCTTFENEKIERMCPQFVARRRFSDLCTRWGYVSLDLLFYRRRQWNNGPLTIRDNLRCKHVRNFARKPAEYKHFLPYRFFHYTPSRGMSRDAHPAATSGKNKSRTVNNTVIRLGIYHWTSS